ncbi:MAG TPA: LysR substrate-binding domain-containing protein [Fibrobacteria bacterium]|nr:LysR substrate-binding domain-containing protein [Fibrobacteria bacterium]
MNLHHLEIFHAIAVQGSLSRAAEALCTSQPSVTKQLKTFEESLGTRLLDRLPRGIRLTQAGEVLEGHAREIFARRDLATRELQELSGLRRGLLSLASSRTIGSYLLPDLLARFMEAHPGIEVFAQVANTRRCAEMVRLGLVEAALVEGPVEEEGVSASPFGSDELVVVAPASHPLSRRRRPAPLERILSEPLVAREPGSGTREILDRELRRLSANWPPRLELDSTEAIKGLVIAGAGLAVVSKLAVAREVEAGVLAVVRVEGLHLARELGIVRSTDRTTSPAMRAFEGLLGGPVARRA